MKWSSVREHSDFQAIDRHFGDLLFELAEGQGAAADVLACTAALISQQRTAGHACLELEQWAERPLDPSGVEPGALPSAEVWRSALLDSKLCSNGSIPSPLVLDDRGFLYLFRYWTAERDLAELIRARLDAPLPVDADKLSARLRTLFTEPPGDDVDHQALAAVAVAGNRLTVITGGPGTGKTTTVARILALLLDGDPTLRIALAAPTGKAAARLGQSIGNQLEALGVDAESRDRIPAPRTLHRLLGYLPHSDVFRHDRDNPHPADLIVIDEASMVDLLLMRALFAAARPGARLVLLGDHNQLASVATGQVLADLCAAAGPERGPGPRLAKAFTAATGQPVAERDDPSGLADATVVLERNYRFAQQPGIATVAAAIVDGDAEAALAALRSGFDDVHLLHPSEDDDCLLAPVETHLEAQVAAASPEEALRAFESWQILCAVRGGPFGVDRINRRVETRLATLGMRVDGPWYRGRPVLVTANDYGTHLFNGDVGICWPDAEGRPSVWFRDSTGQLRTPLSPTRLPPCETAWATTVHKSQGSEFDEVLLVLPDADSPVCTAALVYTALTRARTRVYALAAVPELVKTALGRRQLRASGLGHRLGVDASNAR